MVSRNKELRTWLDMGVCRCSALSRAMLVSRQYLNKVASLDAGISENQWQDIQFGIEIVEADERMDQKSVEQNIIRCARMCASTDRWVSKKAKSELDRWVMILASHKESF